MMRKRDCRRCSANETGVLTPEGQLVVEPSLEFSHSTSNRFFAQGVEVVNSVFIGLLEVNEADRDTITSGLEYSLRHHGKFRNGDADTVPVPP